MIRKAVILVLISFSLPVLAWGDDFRHFDVVVDRICAWQEAWQKKDLDLYMSFYSPSFKSGKLGYKGWQTNKKQLFQRPGSISVNISGLCIKNFGQKVVLNFIQHYHSSTGISDVGEKTLVMKKIDGAWKIVSEKWKPLVSATSKETDAVEPAPLEGLHVKNITATVKDGKTETESVLVRLNLFYIPEFSTTEGASPRIVMDFPHVSFWRGPAKIPFTGKMIRRIRAYLYYNCRTLRIVLDLEPFRSYRVKPLYYKGENIFCLEVVRD